MRGQLGGRAHGDRSKGGAGLWWARALSVTLSHQIGPQVKPRHTQSKSKVSPSRVQPASLRRSFTNSAAPSFLVRQKIQSHKMVP